MAAVRSFCSAIIVILIFVHKNDALNEDSGNALSDQSQPSSSGLSENQNDELINGTSGTRRIEFTINDFQPKPAKHSVKKHFAPIFMNNAYYIYRPPPKVVHKTPSGDTFEYPTYRKDLPNWVYEYRSSTTRYRKLLAGLSIYNMARALMNPTAYNFFVNFQTQKGQACFFIVKYNTGAYEEMTIDCRAIVDFMWSDLAGSHDGLPQLDTGGWNENEPMKSNYNTFFLHNGTVIHRQSNPLMNFTEQIVSSNGSLVNITATPVVKAREVKTKLANGTVVTTFSVPNAVDPLFSGEAVQLEPGMECFIKCETFYTKMINKLSCDLLQDYGDQISASINIKSSLSLIIAMFSIYFINN